MADSLKERLRQIGSRVGMKNRARDTATGAEAADRIEKLEEENSVLFVANVRLNSRADLDCDHYRDRIEKLEVALREIVEQERQTAHPVVVHIITIARKALEGTNGP